jgi:hypothetical protein
LAHFDLVARRYFAVGQGVDENLRWYTWELGDGRTKTIALCSFTLTRGGKVTLLLTCWASSIFFSQATSNRYSSADIARHGHGAVGAVLAFG